ncbi:phosphotransferase family protein [Anaerocolumna xylanovorans]|uniref:Ser/Thr protein kinase RdoA involved in Cpx stress response, MazF antagonist n=1 Tax=Anaerocolumna xylanovorans DSM 12503 TaxID=1121345 RepID=A0A1M7Y2G3_9FIRM|nr:aminoglycoside phosphotransferase family protein [Anaerocolumna xylanovorans]SHO46083.1 Ser/Thr protein kinase RdoA involved in Cpx stress response, MazF antagonist [Anaerocolumna xylanovorans DSM 12503]
MQQDNKKGEGVKSYKTMDSITKSSITDDTIRKIAENAFPSDKVKEVRELTGGYFNAAYLVAFDKKEVILKIAPPKKVPVMSYEKDIMRAETDCMELVKDRTDIPVPDILFCDYSHTVCPSDYFFMSKLEGMSFSSIKETFTEEEKNLIEFHTGEYNSRINSITGEGFGYYNRVQKGIAWFEVFLSFFADIFKDAGAIGLDTGMDYASIEELLTRHKSYFAEVTTPRLLHWDLWEGNVFVMDKRITGFIDFERCMWADVLLEVGFRSHYQKPHFLAGYGKKEFTEAEKVRILWYDLYLFFLALMESDYRKYPDRGMYFWAKEQIEKTLPQLKEIRP